MSTYDFAIIVELSDTTASSINGASSGLWVDGDNMTQSKELNQNSPLHVTINSRVFIVNAKPGSTVNIHLGKNSKSVTLPLDKEYVTISNF